MLLTAIEVLGSLGDEVQLPTISICPYEWLRLSARAEEEIPAT